jgi:hypothetical protein
MPIRAAAISALGISETENASFGFAKTATRSAPGNRQPRAPTDVSDLQILLFCRLGWNENSFESSQRMTAVCKSSKLKACQVDRDQESAAAVG